MKKICYVAICCLLCLCAVAGFWTKPLVVSADNSFHTVTFNFNASDILPFIPTTTTSVLDSLKTYSVTVGDGECVQESRTPQSIILTYYDYDWTVNGAVVDLDNFVITQDTSLVASWTPKDYHVYFQFESDEVKDSITNLVESLSFNVESGRIELYKPIRPNYYFEGWYVLGNPIEYLYIPARTIGDKWYTARFSPINYYINYHTDGTNHNPTSYNVEGENITLVEPTLKGHIFKGWYNSASFDNKVTVIDTKMGGNINLYPLWELEKYTVTYILPDGSSQDVEVEYGKKANLPSVDTNIFTIVKTNVSRNNITQDTTIHIEYINIWYVYLIGLAVLVGVIVAVVLVIKKRRNTHSTLREFYQSNSRRSSRR